MKIHAIFAIVIFLLPFFCAAQIDTTKQEKVTPTSVEQWSLQRCIEHAWANNLTVRRSELDVENSAIDLRQAQLSRWPNLSANSNYGYSWGRGLDPVTNLFTTQEINSINVGAQTAVTIFNGMRINNLIQQNKSYYESSTYDLQRTKNDVALNVATFYTNVLFNKAAVENATFQLASTKRQLERAQIQVTAGALPLSDQLNLEAQVASNELNLIQQENALALSILQLKQVLLIPADQPFDIETPDIEPEDLVIDQSRDEIFQIARQTMPEIKVAELRIESGYYGVKASKGNLYPRLSLFGSINSNYSSAQDTRPVEDGSEQLLIGYTDQVPQVPVYTTRPTYSYVDYPLSDQLEDNLYRSVGVQLNIPIFNNYINRAAVQRSVVQYEQLKVNSLEASQTLRQNVERAYNDAVAASKTYNSALKQVAAREEAFRATQQRYDIGAANYFDYQVSENDLFRARADLIRAKYDYILRSKILDFYQGKPLQF